MLRNSKTPWSVAVLIILSFLSCVHRAESQDAAGGIRGTVIDAEFADPVPEASVRVLEIDQEAQSNQDGHFVFSRLPPGEYTLLVTKAGYQRFVKSGVPVTPGTLEEITVEMKGEFTEMEEFVVRDLQTADATSETGLLELRKTDIAFQDSVSRDLMSKAGAGDAAAALKLVVGASVVDGKYATVRGLSDRYVGTALNSIRVPSSDPKKRSVHMDIFPAGTIQSLSVSKTFTPDIPGDYTGGGVNIRTISIPEKDFLKASLSQGVHSLYSGKDGFMTYDGAGCGLWGRHMGARGLPDGFADMEANGLFGPSDGASSFDHPLREGVVNDPTTVELDRLTRSLAPVIGTKRTEMPSDYGISVSRGSKSELGGEWVWGSTAALTYGRKFSLRHDNNDTTHAITENSGGGADVTNLNVFVRDVGSEELKWSTLLSAGIAKGEDHDVSITLLRNRAATDEASMKTEEHPSLDEIVKGVSDIWQQDQSIHYTERSLNVIQVRGNHKLDMVTPDITGLEVGWYFARNQAEQEEPDVRNFENYIEMRSLTNFVSSLESPVTHTADSDSATRIWRNTSEDNYVYGLNIGIPFKKRVSNPHAIFWGEDPGSSEATGWVKFGLSRDRTYRTYGQTAFSYEFPGQRKPVADYYGAPAEPYRNPNSSAPAAERWVYTDFNGDLHYGPNRPALMPFYNNDLRDNWLPSEEGQFYQDATNAWAYADSLRNFRSDRSDSMWSDVFLDPNRIGAGPYSNSCYWVITPKTRDVSYTGIQIFDSGYWMLEVPLTRQMRIMGGARLELTDMKIDPVSDIIYQQDYDSNRVFEVVVIDESTGSRYIDSIPLDAASVHLMTSAWLFAAGAIYEPMENMYVRFNWGQTIARPTFRELAPVINRDFIAGENFIGNRDLTVSRIQNHDVRWEWFRKPGEVLSASWFHKSIEEPIEKIMFSYLNTKYTQAVNYPSGTLSGYEAEFRKKLDFLPAPLSYFSVGCNYTVMDASVTLAQEEQDRLAKHFKYGGAQRPMEGQPTVLRNANVSWDHPRWGTSFSLFYNHAGDILKSGASVGRSGSGDSELTVDLFTQDRETVTASFTQMFGGTVKLRFVAKNIMNPLIREIYRDSRDGTDTVRREYQEGVYYTLGVEASW